MKNTLKEQNYKIMLCFIITIFLISSTTIPITLSKCPCENNEKLSTNNARITVQQEQRNERAPQPSINENTFSTQNLYNLQEPTDWQQRATFTPITPEDTLPEKFDWRLLDGCTPIKNQGGGGCWAFATTGPLECNIKIKDGITVDLSEQWLISCNTDGWNYSAGWFAHDYHMWKTDPCGDTGAVLEADCPYEYGDIPCSCPYPHPYQINDWSYIGSPYSIPPTASIKQAILDYGPVSCAVISDDQLKAYAGGIFTHNATGNINHGVVLVGWDDTQGPQGVWIMRNSWSSAWGEGGYMRIPYGYSKIGYAAAYIDYLGTPTPVQFSYPLDQPTTLSPSHPTIFPVTVEAQTSTPVPQTGWLHYSINDEPTITEAMQEIEPNQYEAVLPASDLNDQINWYVSIETEGSTRVYDPPFAPFMTYTATVESLEEYTLQVYKTGSGQVTQDPNWEEYPPDSLVELTAYPQDGWSFWKWTEDGATIGYLEEIDIIMDEDKTIIAYFTQDQYMLDINVEGSGTVTINPSQSYYTYGEEITITAYPSSGWILDHWSGAIFGNMNPKTTIINEDKIVIAHFKQIDYYVDDDYTSSTPGWQITRFDTIQSCINQAATGEVIYVHSGTYYEDLIIDTAALTLYGENPITTIIQGSGTGNTVFLDRDNINLNGFTIKQSGNGEEDAGIYLNNDNNILSRNFITDTQNGIFLNAGDEHIITDNILTNNFRGIYFDRSDANIVTNNQIEFCDTEGMHLDHSCDNNIIVGNTITYANTYGIYIDHSGGNLLQDNSISDCTTGLTIEFSSSTTILENSIFSNTENGIFLYVTDTFTITNNIITLNGQSGISQLSATANTISNNLIYDNNEGLTLETVASSNICDNTIASNVYGIDIDYSDSNNIANNDFQYNSESIYLDRFNTQNVIHGNIIDNSYFAAVELYSDNTDNTIENNHIINSELYGVYIRRSDTNTIKDNTITDNRWGLYLEQSHENIIIDNIITSNIEYGIYLSNSDDNNVLLNTVAENGNIGIDIDTTQNNDFQFNTINIHNIAINLYFTSDATITGNYIAHSLFGVALDESHYNIINQNQFSQNQESIYLDQGNTYNIITDNIIEQSYFAGIELYNDNYDNTIIDNIIQTSDQYGIYLQSSNHNNISNNQLYYNKRGLYLGYSHENTISNNIILITEIIGIETYLSHYNSISGNIINTFETADITLEQANNNTISDNTCTNSNSSINLHYSCNNSIGENTIYASHLQGIYLDESNYTFISENYIISNQLTGIKIDTSHSNTITSNEFLNNPYGILQDTCTYTNISNNTIQGVYYPINPGRDERIDMYGIKCFSCEYIQIINNTITHNEDGIGILDYSSHFIVEDNTFMENGDGIYIWKHCQQNNITDNIFKNSDFAGVFISNQCTQNNIANNLIEGGNNYGIVMSSSTSSTLQKNYIFNTYIGIHLANAQENDIIENTVTSNNNMGIQLGSTAFSNSIYHNNFINNGQNAIDEGENSWDAEDSGNFWSDYTGEDADGDGIGDFPYDIPGGTNSDRLPLMQPWMPCPWDVNFDGMVDPQDVGLVKYYYGQDPSIPEYSVYDVNLDGVIDPQDVGLVKYFYGPCPVC